MNITNALRMNAFRMSSNNQQTVKCFTVYLMESTEQLDRSVVFLVQQSNLFSAALEFMEQTMFNVPAARQGIVQYLYTNCCFSCPLMISVTVKAHCNSIGSQQTTKIVFRMPNTIITLLRCRLLFTCVCSPSLRYIRITIAVYAVKLILNGAQKPANMTKREWKWNKIGLRS